MPSLRQRDPSSVPSAEPTWPRRVDQGATRGCIAIATGDAVTRPLKTSESVARDVAHDIITLGLQPGDSLPPEAAMLQHYGVSRESLREGLRLLEVQGLISIRRGPGGGPIVGTVDPANLGRSSTLYYHMAGATYQELFEAWTLAESLLAERAARHPDREARAAAMEPYLDSGVHEAPEDVARFVQEQGGFHTAVASLARNRVLELTLQTMGRIVSHHVAVVDDPREVRRMLADDHLTLAKAIIAGHPTRAHDLMERHIMGVVHYYGERAGTKLDDFIEWR